MAGPIGLADRDGPDLVHYDRLRLLIVDDNHHMRLLLAEVLRAIGVRQIEEAGDGGQALALLRDHTFDVVVTDLVMPGAGGLELIRQLRAAEGPNQMAPVIVVSGQSTGQAVRDARDAGANEFLTKPIAVRPVLERLHAVVTNARPFLRTESYSGPDRRRRADPDYVGPMRRHDDPQPSAAGDSPPPTQA